MIRVQEQLNASYERAWSQLWRKAYETKDFIPALSELIIHEKSDDVVLRTMKLGPMTIKERITRNPETGIVTFSNIEGSDVQGDIFNSLEKREGKLYLVFSSNATKDGKGVPQEEMFRQTLQHTKKIIESK